MGLLQNGFKDVVGVVRFYGAGQSNGALPQQLNANYALTGMRRNLTAGEGITDDKVGLPMGYLVGGSYQLPQKPGQLSARAYAIAMDGAAAGTSGLPASGSASLAIADVAAVILPEDDASPLRSGSSSIEITATATGELKMSGSGTAEISVTAGPAAAVGIVSGTGSAEISVTTNAPILGAEAGGSGEAVIFMSATANILPEDDTPPSRTASASIYMTGSLVPYAIGSMSGSTGAASEGDELTAEQIAQAVWSYEQ